MTNETALFTTLVDIVPVFKNFDGKERPFNPPGKRSFGINLTDEQAKELEAEGWPVKHPRRPDGERTSILLVNINPNIDPYSLISIDGRDCDTDRKLSLLDKRNDLIGTVELHGHQWTFGDKSGVKTYLKSLNLKSVKKEPMFDAEGNEFRRIPGFVSNSEVNRAGIVRDGDTGEVYHDLANPEEIEAAFPDMVKEEQWELIENGKYEISERGAIRRADTKEVIRSREGSKDPMIQSYLDDVFPDRKS